MLDAARKEGYGAVTLCRPFDTAVRVARLIAKKGQSVLLSPASASFDAFRSYEERGDRFAEIVRLLAEEETRRGSAASGGAGREEQGE